MEDFNRCQNSRSTAKKNHVFKLFLSFSVFNFARSGFSLIDLVENSTTKRRYALKRITCHSIEDQKLALREVELTRTIKHPNIVEIIDFELKGDADIVINTISHVHILFPFYKHGSLQDHLNMRAKLNDHMAESQVLQIFVGICEGLKALHEAKPEPLAHRDLKTGEQQ